MVRNLVLAVFLIGLLTGCATMRPAGNASTKPAPAAPVKATPQPAAKKADIRFLDDISTNPQLTATIPDTKTEAQQSITVGVNETNLINSKTGNYTNLQLKYASLLGTEPDLIENTELLKSADEWYGTRYLMGGTTHSGIDCSAFVQAVYAAAFGMMIPRTAFEQFKAANRISAVEMKEGDLVFFNTTGGVSHVGIYLRNNKFIHASSSKGVTVSDLFDPYYLKRFLGVGRIERPLGTR